MIVVKQEMIENKKYSNTLLSRDGAGSKNGHLYIRYRSSYKVFTAEWCKSLQTKSFYCYVMKATPRVPLMFLKTCPHLIQIRSTSISHLNHHFVRTGSRLDQSTSILSAHYELNCDNSYTRPQYCHVIAYLSLAVTQSCFCRGGDGSLVKCRCGL